MFKQLKLLWLCCLVIFPTWVTANSNSNQSNFVLNNPQYTHLESLEGVQLKVVSSITQSQNGFIWLGSTNGLFRFDGYETERYQHIEGDDNSLSSNEIYEVTHDKQGNLWIITTGEGLNRLDPGTGRVERLTHDPAVTTSLPSNMVFSLLERDDNSFWLSHDKGLGVFDTRDQTYTPLAFDNISGTVAPTKILRDAQGKLWMTTNTHGLLHYDPVTRKAKRYNYKNEYREDFFGPIWLDKNDTLWVGNKYGLHILDRTSGRLQPVRDKMLKNAIYKLLGDNNGNLWIGTISGKLLRYHLATQTVTEWPVDGDHIIEIFQDQQNLLWVGTGTGVKKLNLNGLGFRYIANTGPMINNILNDNKDQVWLSNDEGVYRFDEQTLQIDRVLDLTNVWEMASHNDDLYLLKWRSKGGYSIDKHSTLDGHFVKNVAQLPADTHQSNNMITGLTFYEQILWYHKVSIRPNKEMGLFGINVDSGEQFNAVTSDGILAMVGLPESRLLIITISGLAEYQIKERRFRTLSFEQQPKIKPLCLFRGSNNIVWVCLRNIGLGAYNSKTGTLEIFEWDSGSISSIVADDNGQLWLGTKDGTVRFDPSTKEFTQYTPANGAPRLSHYNSSTKTAKGGILQITRNGLLFFDPAKLGNDNVPRKTLITQFNVLNKKIDVQPDNPDALLRQPIEKTRSLTLDHQDYVFSLRFTTPDHLDYHSLRFAYKMEGLDQDWFYTTAKNRTATYTTLSPGNYRFRVKGTNNSGVWNEGTGIDIEILPAWWATKLAYISYAIIVFGIIAVVFWLRTTQLRRRAEVLEKGIVKRTEQLQQRNNTINQMLAEKDRLFANVSHEFRTPLTLIKGPLEQAINLLSDKTIKTPLLLAKTNASRMQWMVDQLLDLVQLQDQKDTSRKTVDAVDIATFVLASYHSLAEKRQIKLTLDNHTDEPLWLNLQPDALEKIISNLVSNAIKYSDDEHPITLSISTEEQTPEQPKHVCLTVKDKGIGISETQQQQIFERFTRLDNHTGYVPGVGIGLALVKELVQFHKGRITVQSTPGVGSEFSVFLPLADKTGEPATDVNQTLVHSGVEQMSEQAATSQLPQQLSFEPTEQTEQATLLIIEDNPEMRGYIASCLEAHYNVLLAPDGQQGIETALKVLPDLVISDIAMPLKDGFAVAETLKNTAQTCHIPLILLTAHTGKDSRLKGWAAQVDEFLQKPFDATELLARVDNLLAIRTLLRQSSQRHFIDPSQKKADAPAQLHPQDSKFLAQVDQLLNAHYGDELFDVGQFADRMHLSKRQLHRKLKTLVDMTSVEAIRNFRLKKAAQLLTQGVSPSVVSHTVGFNSHSYFSQCFKAQYGCHPSAYCEGGQVAEK